MGAFFSGTDDNDDRASCAISGVVGKLSTNPELVFRFNLPGGGKESKIEMKMNEIFEEAVPPSEVPAEWLAQVQKEAPVVSTFRSGYDNLYGGSGYQGGYGGGRGGRTSHNSRVAGQSSSVSDLTDIATDELLERLGFPFAKGSEEGSGPFVGAPSSRGRSSNKKLQVKKAEKSSRKVLQLPTRQR